MVRPLLMLSLIAACGPPTSASFPLAAAPPVTCARGAVSAGPLVLCLDDVAWDTAARRCADAGLGLAIVRDDDTQRAIEALLARAGGTATDAPWIGLRKHGDALVWRDGRAATFTFFTPGEPNGGGLDACVHANWPPGRGSWNDAACDAAQPWSSFVCQADTYDVVAVAR